jgi:hypothetical protein
MDALILKPTYNSPNINFDAQNGVLEISGRSIPEHANMFYDKLIHWVKEYVTTQPPKTEVNIKLDYLNSSSHKYLIELLEKLEPIHSNGFQILVNWYFEEDDDEIKETGKECSELVKVPFNFIPVEVE